MGHKLNKASVAYLSEDSSAASPCLPMNTSTDISHVHKIYTFERYNDNNNNHTFYMELRES